MLVYVNDIVTTGSKYNYLSLGVVMGRVWQGQKFDKQVVKGHPDYETRQKIITPKPTHYKCVDPFTVSLTHLKNIFV